MANDGFTLVNYKRPRQYNHSNKHKSFQSSGTQHQHELCHGESSGQRLDSIIKYIENCKVEIKTSSFYQELLNTMLESLSEGTVQDGQIFQDFICYGIGHLSESSIARYQFGLLLLLWEQFRPTGECFIYDPVFNSLDKETIKHFNLILITENEEAKRNVSCKTLFYVPHCGKPLYNNILWANWGLSLANVVIIGNSFNSYEEKIPSQQLSQEAGYISHVFPVIEEVKFPTFFHGDIFNDMSVHFFRKDRLEKQESSFWKDCSEPVYGDDDVEIILK